ncbi:MAG TPA: hypothetical protein VJO33_09870 [Gemmatimonadaceae bacterium]|nr:hypothetical protein [Gemmatimonadaceae bacterium]
MLKSFSRRRCFAGAVALIAVAVAGACATSSRPSSGIEVHEGKTYRVSDRADKPKVTQHFDTPADDTWRAVGLAFKDLNYAGAPSATGNERLYMTPMLRLEGRLYADEWNSAYFDCGRTPAGTLAADSYVLTFTVMVWVDTDEPSGSSVRILVNGLGRDRTNPSGVAQCSGTGRLEAAFLKAIQRRLNL